MSEVDFIIQSVKDSYDGQAWHGPNIMSILDKIPENQSGTRIGSGHSIAELVLHMTAWRNFVIQKLEGNDSYDVSDEENFPRPGDWANTLKILRESQFKLIEAIEKFGAKKLDQTVAGRKYTFRKLLHGIVDHDLYHLGQIVMITKQF